MTRRFLLVLGAALSAPQASAFAQALVATAVATTDGALVVPPRMKGKPDDQTVVKYDRVSNVAAGTVRLLKDDLSGVGPLCSL